MKKTTGGLAGLTAVGALVAAGAVLAAPGDVTYTILQPSIDQPATNLTNVQTSCMAAWAKTVWPSLAPANTRDLNCTRKVGRGVACVGVERRTVTKAEFIDADVDGHALVDSQNCTVVLNGADVTYCHRWGQTILTTPQRIGLKTCAGNIWAGADLGGIMSLILVKENGIVTARFEYRITKEQAEFIADRAAGVVSRTISVEE